MGMSAYYSPMMNSFTIVEGPDPCFYLKTPQSPTWMEKVGNLMSNPILLLVLIIELNIGSFGGGGGGDGSNT